MWRLWLSDCGKRRAEVFDFRTHHMKTLPLIQIGISLSAHRVMTIIAATMFLVVKWPTGSSGMLIPCHRLQRSPGCWSNRGSPTGRSFTPPTLPPVVALDCLQYTAHAMQLIELYQTAHLGLWPSGPHPSAKTMVVIFKNRNL
jgi:hypothetical protein